MFEGFIDVKTISHKKSSPLVLKFLLYLLNLVTFY